MYKLRWRFEYSDGKPPKYGIWSSPGPKEDLTSKAWAQDKTNLARALIEAQDTWSPEKKTIVAAECRGEDFCNFEFKAAARMFGMRPSGGSAELHGVTVGMVLVTREQRINVYTNGVVEPENRTEEDKKFHLASYGR